MPISISELSIAANAAKSQKATPFTALLPSPTTQQLSDTIKELQKLVNALEARLARMEGAVVISADGNVMIYASKDLGLMAGRMLDLQGDYATFKAINLKVAVSGNLDMQANHLHMAASMIAVSTAMMQVSGTVKCDTIIANSVVGSSYTPGAGNIW